MPFSVLPNFTPEAVVTSGITRPWAFRARSFRMRSMPAVMLPHWSLPPICTRASVAIEQLQEVVRLQQQVAELGERNPLFALEPAVDRLLLEHVVHGEVLARVAKKREQIDRAEPVGVVDDPGGVVPASKSRNRSS